MRKRFIHTAVLFSLLTIGIGGLCGCGNPPAVHTTEELTAVSISHAGMDRSYNYSFGLHSDADVWLFEAACFINQNEVEIELTSCPITAEEADECMSILAENDLIAYVENHKSTKQVYAPDMESKNLALTFSDGTQYTVSETQSELKAFFYGLAEKYANADSSKP